MIYLTIAVPPLILCGWQTCFLSLEAFFCYKLFIPPAEPVVYWFTNNKKDCGKMKRHSLFVIYIFEKCCQGVRS